MREICKVYYEQIQMETNEMMNEVVNETTETVMETAADSIPRATA